MLGARAGLALSCAATIAALAPATALADSDPASDFLPTQNVFLPYQPRVSAGLTKDLQSITRLAAKSGYKIKVAIIATAIDLGGVPQLFNQPARYAGFLGSEISFNGRQPLLVVMPAGLGTFAGGPRASAAIVDVKVGPGADGMARAAIDAVMKLAAASGHPIRGFKPAAGSGGSGSGGPSALIFGVPVGLLILGLAILTYRRAGAAAEEEEAAAAEAVEEDTAAADE